MVNNKIIMGLALAIGTVFSMNQEQSRSNKEHIIKMMDRNQETGEMMVFSPKILVVNPGDTITFKPTPRGHFSESLKYAIPDGAKEWKTRWGETESINLKKPGFYGYICPPHFPMGMVGLIIVKGEGMYDNFDEAETNTIDNSILEDKEAWEKIWNEVYNMRYQGKLD